MVSACGNHRDGVVDGCELDGAVCGDAVAALSPLEVDDWFGALVTLLPDAP